MAVEVVGGTPLAQALQDVIQPKLAEVGWSSGSDDSALTEYIILMLANGKTQDQISSELSTDLLGLGPDDSSAVDFTRWLFEQVASLDAQFNGRQQQTAVGETPDVSGVAMNMETQDAHKNSVPTGDTAMEESMVPSSGAIPTGPKAMRNGNQNTRDKRMLGQLNKALDRTSDSALHRIRGGASAGRINSHSREPPKGPRNQQLQRGLGMAAAGNGRGIQSTGMPQIPQMPYNGQNNPFMQMSPQQQMQIFAMYEEQARMMQQIITGGPVINPAFQQGGQQRPGRSLFDRVDKNNGNKRQRPSVNTGGKAAQQDITMEEGGNSATDGAGQSAMDTDDAQTQDPLQTVCRFNLTCTKADCPFQHQSPAAPPGTSIDMTDTCSFGAACMNHKCVGRHPSPAKRLEHKAAVDCKFFPNCTNPACPFRHPSMPLCRNGADCVAPGCKFTHSKIKCRYNPCLNPTCPYKHEDGQKRAPFQDNVWTPSEDQKEHVSERKFVVDEGEEELIIPGSGAHEATENTQVIT